MNIGPFFFFLFVADAPREGSELEQSPVLSCAHEGDDNRVGGNSISSPFRGELRPDQDLTRPGPDHRALSLYPHPLAKAVAEGRICFGLPLPRDLFSVRANISRLTLGGKTQSHQSSIFAPAASFELSHVKFLGPISAQPR